MEQPWTLLDPPGSGSHTPAWKALEVPGGPAVKVWITPRLGAFGNPCTPVLEAVLILYYAREPRFEKNTKPRNAKMKVIKFAELRLCIVNPS